jgi:hypothetical protein
LKIEVTVTTGVITVAVDGAALVLFRVLFWEDSTETGCVNVPIWKECRAALSHICG